MSLYGGIDLHANNTVLARKAVAHKLSRACYSMMRDLVPFEATQAFG
jgi:hypothetical protein